MFVYDSFRRYGLCGSEGVKNLSGKLNALKSGSIEELSSDCKKKCL